MNNQRLNLSQYKEAIAAAKLHFAEIRKKYPTLRAYLVLSLRSDQTKPDDELTKSIRECPSLFMDNRAKYELPEIKPKLQQLEFKKVEERSKKERFKKDEERFKMRRFKSGRFWKKEASRLKEEAIRLKDEEARLKNEEARLKEEEERLPGELVFNGRVQFELRFHALNYDLIWKLQSDDLVDRLLTPQTRASIRIVLGTISHFAQEPS